MNRAFENDMDATRLSSKNNPISTDDLIPPYIWFFS